MTDLNDTEDMLNAAPEDDDEDLVVNLSGVQTGFQALAGKFRVRVTDVDLRTSKSEKNPGSKYLNWTFTIQSGKYADRNVWYMTSLLPQALFGLKGLAAASGEYTEEELEGSLNIRQMMERLMGTEVIIETKIKSSKDYDDQTNIKKIYHVDDPKAGDLDDGGEDGGNDSLLP